MHRRYLYTVYLILASFLVSMGDFSEVKSNTKKNINHTEAKLALGEKISLEKVGMQDLELIPGISDKMAVNIIKAKRKVLCSDIKHPLLLVHGVGKKKAKVFENYLDFYHLTPCDF